MSTPPHFLLRLALGAELRVDLPRERSLIGRSAACDIWLDEPNMPAVMGMAVRSMGQTILVADSELRPFIVNGEPAARAVLAEGDSVAFAEFQLLYRAGDEQAPALDGEAKPWNLFRPAAFAPFSRVLADPLAAPALAPAELGPAGAANEETPTAEAPSGSAYEISTAEPTPQPAAAEAPPPTADSPARESAVDGSWGRLEPAHGAGAESLALTASLAMLDLGSGRATLSRRRGQCFATLVSGVVFCAKERLGPKPKEMFDGDMIASGGRVYVLRLGSADPALITPMG